jgi:hypothetical protein
MNEYDYGDKVRCRGEWTDVDGDYQDPTSVFFSYIKPNASSAVTFEYTVNDELVKSGVGIYYVDLDADTVGDWWARMFSTGTGQAAYEWEFRVRDSVFD